MDKQRVSIGGYQFFMALSSPQEGKQTISFADQPVVEWFNEREESIGKKRLAVPQQDQASREDLLIDLVDLQAVTDRGKEMGHCIVWSQIKEKSMHIKQVYEVDLLEMEHRAHDEAYAAFLHQVDWMELILVALL